MENQAGTPFVAGVIAIINTILKKNNKLSKPDKDNM